MRLAIHILLLVLCLPAQGQQYYLRGEVRDESGNALQNVVILHHATGYVYYSGSYGTFGIITSRKVDSLTFSFDGFQKQKIVVDAEDYITVRLKMIPASSSQSRREKLASMTKNLTRENQRYWFTGEETYASLVENRFVKTSKYPETGVALNIDRASYSNIRRFLNMNTLVPPDAVRIEEMLNYFNLCYQEPEPGAMFRMSSVLTSCPWNPANQLYFTNISSRKLELDSLPPTQLVFLIDISGSMEMPNRLPLLKSAFRMLVNNLRPIDTVSIVGYGGAVGVMLQPTGGDEKEKILQAIDELTAGGATPGESGLRIAYTIAKNRFIKGGNNRVILATDGDFNVGIKTEQELEELIAQQRESGIYLTCIGVGMGNYKDSKIQTLARKGNGNYAYFDNFREAEKILLTEFTQTLYSVADDVFLNLKFNPDYVDEYRLIGFDNKVGALNDTLSAIEGGEIGSGYNVMAVFEIQPTDHNRRAVASKTALDSNFAQVNLRYRMPGRPQVDNFTAESKLNYSPLGDLDSAYRFSTSVIMFGSLLRGSPFLKTAGWNDVLLLAETSADENDAQQQEFISLVHQARLLYGKQKKKK